MPCVPRVSILWLWRREYSSLDIVLFCVMCKVLIVLSDSFRDLSTEREKALWDSLLCGFVVELYSGFQENLHNTLVLGWKSFSFSPKGVWQCFSQFLCQIIIACWKKGFSWNILLKYVHVFSVKFLMSHLGVFFLFSFLYILPFLFKLSFLSHHIFSLNPFLPPRQNWSNLPFRWWRKAKSFL